MRKEGHCSAPWLQKKFEGSFTSRAVHQRSDCERTMERAESALAELAKARVSALWEVGCAEFEPRDARIARHPLIARLRSTAYRAPSLCSNVGKRRMTAALTQRRAFSTPRRSEVSKRSSSLKQANVAFRCSMRG